MAMGCCSSTLVANRSALQLSLRLTKTHLRTFSTIWEHSSARGTQTSPSSPSEALSTFYTLETNDQSIMFASSARSFNRPTSLLAAPWHCVICAILDQISRGEQPEVTAEEAARATTIRDYYYYLSSAALYLHRNKETRHLRAIQHLTIWNCAHSSSLLRVSDKELRQLDDLYVRKFGRQCHVFRC